MITITDILLPGHIELDLQQTNQDEAVLHVANLLRDDHRVADWPGFYEGLTARPPTFAQGADFEICIPHARTNTVTSMIMGIGRSMGGIEIPGHAMKVRYVLVIGVPVAWASEYLRIVGALARIFKDPRSEAHLFTAKQPKTFLEILEEKDFTS